MLATPKLLRYPAPFRLFLLLPLTLCVLPAAKAQVSDPVVSASAPVPGAGHNYLGTGTEMVNPANGLLEFDLPISSGNVTYHAKYYLDWLGT
jgi:hypothetical protein